MLLPTVPPSSISIVSASVPGAQLTVTASRTETVRCVTRHSNPAPVITWLVGNTAINSTRQNNTMENKSNKWRSEASLEYMFLKSDLGKRVTCLVTHPAYLSGENKTLAKLDVLCKFSLFTMSS